MGVAKKRLGNLAEKIDLLKQDIIIETLSESNRFYIAWNVIG